MERGNKKRIEDKIVTKITNKEQEDTAFSELKVLVAGAVSFLSKLLDLRGQSDVEATIKYVKSGISIKGHSAWILIFSIFVASTGLNLSSTAVVIGAMLISPLMGPILGIGLSVGINDIDILRKSLVNLGVMVVLSIITSFLFFSIPIFQQATPEIIARTSPDVRDVLIAIAGGFALIVAITRNDSMTNTIAGVAISTALMPPLCTAGYGLATSNWNYLGGALFLFSINSIFISLTTFIIVKYLKFPIVKHIDSIVKKRISRIASLVAFVIFAFSIYTFWNLFQENRYKQNANIFIESIKDKVKVNVINSGYDFDINTIEIALLGTSISEVKKQEWIDIMQENKFLKKTKLIIKQDDSSIAILSKMQVMEDLYSSNQKIKATKEQRIEQKNNQIAKLSYLIKTQEANKLPFTDMQKELSILYKDIASFSFYNKLSSDFNTIDTITTLDVYWKKNTENTDNKVEIMRLWVENKINRNIELNSLVLE